MRCVRVLGGLLALLLVAGCGMIPRDPDDTLERIHNTGELVVGVSPSPPWTIVDGDDISGIEVDLVQGFADRLGVRLRLEPGGEQRLVEELDEGRLHIVIGGIRADSPWTRVAAPTRAYPVIEDATDIQYQHIMLTPMGENRFLSELELFLDEQTGQLR